MTSGSAPTIDQNRTTLNKATSGIVAARLAAHITLVPNTKHKKSLLRHCLKLRNNAPNLPRLKAIFWVFRLISAPSIVKIIFSKTDLSYVSAANAYGSINAPYGRKHTRL